MKFGVTVILFLFSIKAHSMFFLHSAYWSGCVQSRVLDIGKTYGNTLEYCKKKAKEQKFPIIPFQEELLIVEEGRHLFYQGCIIGNYNTKESLLYEKCHSLTKKYYYDITDILKQDPESVYRNFKI